MARKRKRKRRVPDLPCPSKPPKKGSKGLPGDEKKIRDMIRRAEEKEDIFSIKDRIRDLR